MSQQSSIWGRVAALAAGSLLASLLIYLRLRNRHRDESLVRDLRHKINNAFELAEGNLMPLVPHREKVIRDEKIAIMLNMAKNLAHKDKVALLTKNPFEPPFEKGLLICELPPEHRLLYNKYYFYRNHLLVVTQRFYSQKTPLTREDFKQAVLAMRALRGSFFFNCGPESGFSQQHKHIQIFPKESLKLPILEQLISLFESDRKGMLQTVLFKGHTIYLFRGYEFIHGIIRIKPTPSLDSAAQQFHDAYSALLEQQSILLKKQEFSYNLIGCQQFLALIPRRQEKLLDQVGINAVGFMGSILIKDEKLFEQLEYLLKPTDILRELTYTDFLP